MERQYPCQAIVKESIKPIKKRGFKNLSGTEITVLAKERRFCSASGMSFGHKVELPDGFPEPPVMCVTWIIKGKHLKFI